MPVSTERQALAERMADYFSLQLLFAGRMAALEAIPLSRAVAAYTNLHRRFGLGRPDAGPASALWARYTRRLERLATHEAQLAWTMEVFLQAPVEPPSSQRVFGCFSCEAPDPDGAVKIHFLNRDEAGADGPLSAARAPARLAELRAMFSHLRRTHPSARRVRGASWLYNLEAYRRLLPADYVASRTPPSGPIRLDGSSSWGQFLDHEGFVKRDLRARFLRRLDDLAPQAPWRVFPLPVLLVHGPIELFYDFYRV